MKTQQYTFDESIVSDLHKDAYGFRPSAAFYAEWSNSTDDGKQEIWDNLISALTDTLDRIEKEQDLAIASVEKRIAGIIDICNCTREDAIRHLHVAFDTDGDVNYLEWHLCIPYGYLTGVKPGMLPKSQADIVWDAIEEMNFARDAE